MAFHNACVRHSVDFTYYSIYKKSKQPDNILMLKQSIIKYCENFKKQTGAYIKSIKLLKGF